MISLFIGLWPYQSGYAEVYKYVENGVVHYTNLRPETTPHEIFRSTSPISSSSPTKKRPKSSEQSQKLPYMTLINDISKTYQLNPELIKAIIKVESNYNPKAVSPKGAQGLMQLMPATAKRFGVKDTFDPKENIIGGVKFLRYLFNEFGEQNLDLVLAGYNAGEKAVRNYGNVIPPYPETQQYIKKVKLLYLSRAKSKSTKIYRYIDPNGVLAFTNVQRVN